MSSNEVQILNLVFDNILINFVENHKHLGLALSSNAKWHVHTLKTYYHLYLKFLESGVFSLD